MIRTAYDTHRGCSFTPLTQPNPAMRFLILLAFVIVGCSGSGSELLLETGSTVTLSGTVVDVNTEPMAVDGDGVITIETDDGETARIFVAAGEGSCSAEGLQLIGEVAVGDRVEAQGRVVGGANIRPCEGDDHYLRRADG